MTSNEAEAVKLARELMELADDIRPLSADPIWEIQARAKKFFDRLSPNAVAVICRALLTLTSPTGEPQDEVRAAELYSACWKMFMPGSKHSRASVEKHFLAQFAAIRAERAKGWPGTVPACPACASTSDVEWAVCASPDNVCPLKRAKIIPPQEM